MLPTCVTSARSALSTVAMVGGLLLSACGRKPTEHQPPMQSTRPITLLLLGDSLTAGNAAEPGYRLALCRALSLPGRQLQMVGTQTGFPDAPQAAISGCDLHHEGHWGWRTDESLLQLPQWLQSYSPQIALVMLGTNDCFQHQPPDTTLQELRSIALTLRTANPRMALVLSRLIPAAVDSPSVGVCLAQLNAGLPALVAELNSPMVPAWLAEPQTGFSPQHDTYDGIHPSLSGGQKMAAALAPPLLAAIEWVSRPP
jgi:acyl-CoA thioesterase-1